MGFARSKDVLWDEPQAAAFVLKVTRNQSMLLELAKHDFPDLHRRLRAPVQPTAAQTASAVAALPPLPQGSPFPLQAPHNIAGGAVVARMAAAPAPSAAAAAAAPASPRSPSPPLLDDDVVDYDEVVEVGGTHQEAQSVGQGLFAAVVASAASALGIGGGGGGGGAAPKRKRGARGAGARVEMSPESREKADKKNLSKRMKRAAKAAIERSQLLMKKD